MMRPLNKLEFNLKGGKAEGLFAIGALTVLSLFLIGLVAFLAYLGSPIWKALL